MLPMLPALHYQARNGSPQGKRKGGQGAGNTSSRSKEATREESEREQEQPTSPQAHKIGYPPHRQGAGSRSPHHKFAPKNQQKVAWVDLKKFSEKFFVGMFRGKEKPLALSQRKGALTNENREISNLAMQINQKRTKALLNNRGQR